MNILLQSSVWSPFLPPPNATEAAAVDNLYGFIFWLSVVLFLLVVGPMFYFVFKYRVRAGETAKPTPRITHHLGLELTWSVIPSILCLVIAVWGFWDFMNLGNAPADAEEIYVTGAQWVWNFEHKDGTKEINELHVPEGKTFKLILTSQDVIHSFFIPDFRVKHDLPPGRYTSIWFTPNGVGNHQVFCTEYCGDSHSQMLATVKVMTRKDYDEWNRVGTPLGPDETPEKRGEKLYREKSCITCHSIDGIRMTGPSFKGIFGTPQPLTDGSSAIADENYIRESILNPQAKIVATFTPVMPPFQGMLKDNDITCLIAYIKSLK